MCSNPYLHSPSMPSPDALPFLNALAAIAQQPSVAFYAPGHKGGQGISPELRALLGDLPGRADLPELPELDNLFAPDGPLREAQTLAAQTFGAEETFFLVNGSTCGIEAAVLAVCGEGDRILVPRNVHRSVLSALVLSGAMPVYLSPLHHPDWDLALGITAEQVQIALATYPDLRAVVVVSPNYQGVCADIAAISACVHRHGAVLIVDEAHGAHLGFHEDLPTSAIAAGVDLVIQSTHKTLAALSQASMLHVQGHRVDRDRLRVALQITQSTSPNALLLASLDAARHQMATLGTRLMAHTLALAETVRSRLSACAALRCLTPAVLQTLPRTFWLDPTRLTVDVSALGLSGYQADDLLRTEYAITAELPTLRQLVFILTFGNTQADSDRLAAALLDLAQKHSPPKPALAPCLPGSAPPLLSVPVLSPRAAFFAPSKQVAIAHAAGHLSADLLCPYPPGIPLLLPGEVISTAAIAHLRHLQTMGITITGSPDPSLSTLRVIQDPDSHPVKP